MKLFLISLIIFTASTCSYGAAIESGTQDRFCEFVLPCHNNATCIDKLFGSYKCICAPGFSGEHCEYLNGEIVTQKMEVVLNFCSPNEPCINNGTCTKSGSSSKCMCPPNFTGIHCELYFGGESAAAANSQADANLVPATATPQPDFCSTNSTVCQNGGTCKSELFYPYYSCLCTDGISGDNCENNNYTYNEEGN